MKTLILNEAFFGNFVCEKKRKTDTGERDKPESALPESKLSPDRFSATELGWLLDNHLSAGWPVCHRSDWNTLAYEAGLCRNCLLKFSLRKSGNMHYVIEN